MGEQAIGAAAWSWAKAEYSHHRGPAYEQEVKILIKNVMTAQEDYYAHFNRYAGKLDEIVNMYESEGIEFERNPDVKLVLAQAGEEGSVYFAAARHK